MTDTIIALRNNHLQQFEAQLKNSNKLRIISPFVTDQITSHILNQVDGKNIQLITRYDLRDFYTGVSSLEALKNLKKNNSEIRGVYRLHSKLYIFDERTAMVTSANFTSGGMMSNMEFGLLINDKKAVYECISYFNFLWHKTNNSLTASMLNNWDNRLKKLKKANLEEKSNLGLKDEGENCFGTNDIRNELKRIQKLFKSKSKKENYYKNKRYFVKYIGATQGRVSLNTSIQEVIKDSLSHEAVFYSYHPRQIADGDIIYFGRMTSEPYDYAIYGKAIAKHHNRKVHKINAKTKTKHWQEKYCYYNLVEETIFQNGKLDKCVLLRNELINEFGHNSLISTQKRWNSGERNIEVNKSLMQKQFIELTPEAAQWLDTQLSKKIKEYGKVSNKFLNSLKRSL